MPVPDRPTGRVHPGFVVASIRARFRRWQATRWLVAIVATVSLAGLVQATLNEAEAQRVRWGESESVWVASHSLDPGQTLTTRDTELRELPALAIPVDSVRTDPTGLQIRVGMAASEILRTPRLDPAGGGEVAARVPGDHSAITLDVDGDIFAIGDSTELFALATGLSLTDRGTVVAISDGKATVAVPHNEVGDVVSELAKGGVVVILSH